ncbi:hypothetical protein [Paenibacillus koleovorans]|uniref:hypothetical protein n=1 Tax=Paenibacillus koleovorans TaxID=121608 RepID=UPI000FD96BA0|nr:hypothetical protein [Paenibacillus koleovorans]
MLDYLGHSYTKWDVHRWMERQPDGVSILACGSSDESWLRTCKDYCSQGNALLAIGGVYGLEKLLGVQPSDSIIEGWIDWGSSELADGLQSSFHFWDGQGLEQDHEEAEVFGRIVGGRNSKRPKLNAVAIREYGSGVAGCITVDVMKTTCLIQQGIRVDRDGISAPDGTAAIQDGLLKTDDGSVLDWILDRDTGRDEESPYFMYPIVDEWRVLLQRLLMRLAGKIRLPLGQVWFWPEGLDGIGHISHDTDGHSAAHARKMLALLDQAEVNSTWCTLMPGYPGEVYDEIRRAGHEIALHYNALGTEIAESSWSEQHFRAQLGLLRDQVPQGSIVSNKNHYLRWEGDVQFYGWCERAGIKVEQSKGGSKKGNKGFTFGTCHPYRPIRLAHEENRVFPVVSLPTLAWDPPVEARCTVDEAFQLLDTSKEMYGVAHFLFHPGMLKTDDSLDAVEQFLPELVRRGRERNLAWWTAEKMGSWCETRRQIKVEIRESLNNTLRLTVYSDQAVNDLTLLVTTNQAFAQAVFVEGAGVIVSMAAVRRFGSVSQQLIVNICAGKTELLLNGHLG